MLIQAIRYAKFSIASKNLDHHQMAVALLEDTWDEMTPALRTEFTEGFAYLMEHLSFKAAHEKFEYLDEVFYEKPGIEKDEAHVKSTIVIFHNLKKEEIEVEYIVRRREGKWRIYDVILENIPHLPPPVSCDPAADQSAVAPGDARSLSAFPPHPWPPVRSTSDTPR